MFSISSLDNSNDISASGTFLEGLLNSFLESYLLGEGVLSCLEIFNLLLGELLYIYEFVVFYLND